MKKKEIDNILYVSTFPPRECGIATFTKDLTSAMDHRFNPSLKSKILAINENGSSIYNYGGEVKFQLNESDIENYTECAEKVNRSEKIKLVSIQHEFGIFGGLGNGEYLIPFMQKLEKPAVITFHSVIPEPSEERLRVVQAICRRASAIIVMARKAIDILDKVYGVDRRKIYFIPHGIPSISYMGSETIEKVKRSLGLSGRIVLSTFGLINSGKGIEYVIQALPKVVKKYPNLLYLVIGETHPGVRKIEGESYRNRLISLVKRLGLKNNVKFYNKYLTLEEIVDYLSATDVYMFSAQDPIQIVSGTLAYAFGAGKPIIATKSPCAKELLQTGDVGFLVDFGKSAPMEEALFKLLNNPKLREDFGKKAYELSRNMLWQNVAAEYFRVFNKIINVNQNVGLYKFPRLKMEHMFNLTDDTGIIEHSKHSIPDRSSGYTLDDNARALIVAAKHYEKLRLEQSLKLVKTYLGFIYHAQRDDGFFHNRMSYEKVFIDKIGSEDSFGRAIWALGYVISSKSLGEDVKHTAKFIFDNSINNIFKLKEIRPKAFSLLGLYQYYNSYKHKDILDKVNFLASDLVQTYRKHSKKDWKWFENSITYSNGKIPESLYLAYEVTGNKKYLEVAEESLGFLTDLVILDKKLVLVGHNGWFDYGGTRAFYDQQPVDSSSMVQAYATAYQTTGNKDYYERAAIAYQWFLGRNSINQVLYDESSGGCFDGLLPGCVNLNQGAESTVCHLLARLSLEELG